MVNKWKRIANKKYLIVYRKEPHGISIVKMGWKEPWIIWFDGYNPKKFKLKSKALSFAKSYMKKY
jgi:hypothetical protein